MFGYWNYYDESFDWKSEYPLLSPNFEYTIDKLQIHGLSKEESIKLFTLSTLPGQEAY